MAKTAVIYWSGTGNTEQMANAIAEGAGAELFSVSDFTGDIADYDRIAFGCSAMGDEVLEESEFEPFFTDPNQASCNGAAKNQDASEAVLVRFASDRFWSTRIAVAEQAIAPRATALCVAAESAACGAECVARPAL